MDIKPRTVAVFLLILGFVYLLVKAFTFYWIIIFMNIVLIFINSVFLFAYLDVKPSARQAARPLPSISVVVPNYNGERTLLRCIEAVKAMGYPGEKEIIVVDDGSKDSSLSILSEIKGIKVIAKEKNAGKAAALNTGIAKAKGELIVTIDSDTFPEKDCLEKMAPCFEGDVGAVTGFVRAYNAEGIIERIQAVEYLVSFGFFQAILSDIDAIYVTPGPMSVYRADVLRKIGGYDEKNITEDMEIALRMRKYGYRIVTCLGAHIYTEVPTTMKHLFRQRVRWYRGKFANTLQYREMLFNPKYGEFGMFTFPFSVIVEWCIVLFVFLFVAGNIESLFNYLNFSVSWLSASGNLAGLLPSAMYINPSFYFYVIGGIFYTIFVYISHGLAGDRLGLRKFPEMALFILVYGVFILSVFFVGFFKEINNSEARW
ncbi:Glycosyltransferase AglE [uncultured archaeon]|nr:Glycosyltransferase AglE [uncultured archaeon]